MNSPAPNAAPTRNNRILIIDDNPAIHADIRKILCPPISESAPALDEFEAELLGTTPKPAATHPRFEIDSAHQGQEGLAMVIKAFNENRPYALAFVDVRMPPGWDGVVTTGELWKVCPDLQIVICTAYSDYSWDEMLDKLGHSDRLLILKKPFDTVEVLQMACALTEKWELLRQSQANAAILEARVRARTLELEAANTNLQAEVARRAKVEEDLKKSKEAAEAADRAKSAFLANMSHEIRTPMNGVLGMATLLLDSQLDAEQRDYATTLVQSSEGLLAIINDILDFSKIEAGQLSLETIDFQLADQLRIAVELHAAAAAAKGVELILDIDPAVPAMLNGDPLRLRQIVLNLVSNAIKFTAHGEVVLLVTALPPTDDTRVLHFAIRDTGLGIAPEPLANLFQPFVQADSSTTRKFGGTGLGLAISRRLSELMQGDIGVTSQLGEGSTFWFTARFRAATAPASAAPVENRSLVNRRILVVDDNATHRELLARYLTAWGASHGQAHSVSSGLAEFRRFTATHPYELVIVDHHLDTTDGLKLINEIRADPHCSRPAFVLLSSRKDKPTTDQLQSLGIASCELKPVNPDKLYRALARQLDNQRPPTLIPLPANLTPVARKTASILVVEDNKVNQKVIRLLMEKMGYEIDLAGNGYEAIAALNRKRYALILMDEQMPEMDGLEATRYIRQAQAANSPYFPPGLKIVAMTAKAMTGDRQACLAAGMDDYLSKPVVPEALREMLTRYLPAIVPTPAITDLVAAK